MKRDGLTELPADRWTRPEDYLGAMARKRGFRRGRRAKDRTEPEIAAYVAFDYSVPGANGASRHFDRGDCHRRLPRDPAAAWAAPGRTEGTRIRSERLVPGSREGIPSLGSLLIHEAAILTGLRCGQC